VSHHHRQHAPLQLTLSHEVTRRIKIKAKKEEEEAEAEGEADERAREATVSADD
jgi:hypothetical protein